MNSYDLWPKSSVSFINYSNSTSIEDKFFTFWNSGYPVLTSSAKVSIILALKNNQISRGDYVGLQPFISPCVVKSVSTQAMPNYQQNQQNHSTIIYHQYGYLHNAIDCGNLIEDAVDSLCVPGSNLLPLGGRYEIWSLPKILGTSAGSVIWCKNIEDASAIRKLRDSANKNGFMQWTLRILGSKWIEFYYYWEGGELYHNGKLPKIAIGDILKKIESFDRIIEDRIKKLNILKHLVPDELILSRDRLPCLIPLTDLNSTVKSKLFKLGFNLNERHMVVNKNDSRGVIKFFPLPIHQDVPLDVIIQVSKIIKNS